MGKWYIKFDGGKGKNKSTDVQKNKMLAIIDKCVRLKVSEDQLGMMVHGSQIVEGLKAKLRLTHYSKGRGICWWSLRITCLDWSLAKHVTLYSWISKSWLSILTKELSCAFKKNKVHPSGQVLLFHWFLLFWEGCTWGGERAWGTSTQETNKPDLLWRSGKC